MSQFLVTGCVRSAQYIGRGFEVNAAEYEAATGVFPETEPVFVLLEARIPNLVVVFRSGLKLGEVLTFPVGPK